ncbi:MAG: DUF2637 domain-containing protein [Rhodococcus sp. (in: high G+C Gram-positive bacteria)]|jgi:hypothetical protein|uniref:DUF2637 domain-containing protein n=1 Tax=Rhodococcus qingshengii TaxID=334542 RepID=A0AAW6LLA0_RHOSG|nr:MULTISPECIES: DUF2637 domain-containing protein [Rhodococcus]MDE8647504.1 DUF2637 domain-containing protein [Rhodococcus qingshengii]
MNDLNVRAARMRLYNLIGSVFFAILIAVGITVGAFVLSFAVLQDLALQAQMPDSKAYIFPLIVDGAILGATVGVIVLSKIDGSDVGKRFFQCLLVLVVFISVAGNAYHAFTAAADVMARAAAGEDVGLRPLNPIAAALIAVVPPLLVLAFTHGIGLLIKAIGAAYREYNDLMRRIAMEAESVEVPVAQEPVETPEERTYVEEEPVLWDGDDFGAEYSDAVDDGVDAPEPVAAQTDDYSYVPPSWKDAAPTEPTVTASAEPFAHVTAPVTQPVIVHEKAVAPVEKPEDISVTEPTDTATESVSDLASTPVGAEDTTAPADEPPAATMLEASASAVSGEQTALSADDEIAEPVTVSPADELTNTVVKAESLSPSMTPEFEPELTFLDAADIHDGEKEVARLKLTNPEWSFEQVAAEIGGSASFSRRRYKRAAKAASDQGLRFPEFSEDGTVRLDPQMADASA